MNYPQLGCSKKFYCLKQLWPVFGILLILWNHKPPIGDILQCKGCIHPGWSKFQRLTDRKGRSGHGDQLIRIAFLDGEGKHVTGVQGALGAGIHSKKVTAQSWNRGISWDFSTGKCTHVV